VLLVIPSLYKHAGVESALFLTTILFDWVYNFVASSVTTSPLINSPFCASSSPYTQKAHSVFKARDGDDLHKKLSHVFGCRL